MLDAAHTIQDGRGVPRARLRLALLVAGCVPVLLACSGAETASRDQAAADPLGHAITGGNPTMVVAARGTPLGVEVVTTLATRAEAGGGLSYEQATLGACLRTRATPGSAAGADERGTVETEAVPCPDGVVPVADGVSVEATTTDLRTRQSDVPRPDPRGCLSGSDECVGG